MFLGQFRSKINPNLPQHINSTTVQLILEDKRSLPLHVSTSSYCFFPPEYFPPALLSNSNGHGGSSSAFSPFGRRLLAPEFEAVYNKIII